MLIKKMYFYSLLLLIGASTQLQGIQIYIKSATGGFYIDANEGDTIKGVKEKIEARYGIPIKKQTIVIEGKSCPNEATVGNFDWLKQECFHLIVKNIKIKKTPVRTITKINLNGIKIEKPQDQKYNLNDVVVVDRKGEKTLGKVIKITNFEGQEDSLTTVKLLFEQEDGKNLLRDFLPSNIIGKVK
jgi:hypothetical protein